MTLVGRAANNAGVINPGCDCRRNRGGAFQVTIN